MSGGNWWREFFLSGDYRLEQHTDPERTEREARFLARALRTGPGSRVLDLCCGIGRHANALARMGCRVVGVDFTPSYLVPAATGPALFVRGDMRRVPLRGQFDAAYNVFSSFAYFDDDEEDARVIREVARLPRPDGRFVLDVLNPLWIARRFQQNNWVDLGDSLLLETREMDFTGWHIRSDWTFVRGDSRNTHPASIRLYTPPELRRMLDAAGMSVETLYGNFAGDPLGLDTNRQIVVSVKRG